MYSIIYENSAIFLKIERGQEPFLSGKSYKIVMYHLIEV